MESPAEAYPVPVVGEDEDQPGFWAHSALNNPWPRGRRVRERPGTLLHTLQTAPLRREPGLRTLKNGEDFYYTIGTKTANIEALLPPIAHTAIPQTATPEMPDMSEMPKTLKELDETLAKEILARDSVMALLHDHDRRIEELVATKAIMQASEQEHC
ncbi:hypothetical protein N7534_008633 [Penicillium rubens]|nr:hypothetical protein N7534_008633 [Penicillium rubens]